MNLEKASVHCRETMIQALIGMVCGHDSGSPLRCTQHPRLCSVVVCCTYMCVTVTVPTVAANCSHAAAANTVKCRLHFRDRSSST